MSFLKSLAPTQKVMLVLCGIFLIGVILCTAVSQKEDTPMTNAVSFRNLAVKTLPFEEPGFSTGLFPLVTVTECTLATSLVPRVVFTPEPAAV